jgi:hypothetical protein
VSTRRVPREFLALLKRKFLDVRDLRWNDALSRWELISDSLGGQPVSQFWGWFVDPSTGQRLAPDPVTGLYPFRDLDASGQLALLENLERGFQLRGANSWRQKIAQRSQWNRSEQAKRITQRAQTFADLIAECDLRRPWKKEHERRRGAGRVLIPMGGVA